MSRMRFEVTTLASPEQVREALTDFTHHRPQIWNRTLDPKTYECANSETLGSGPRKHVRLAVLGRLSLRLVRPPGAPVDGGGDQLGWVWHGIDPDRPVDGGSSRVHAEWTYTGASRTRDKVMLS